MPSLEDELRSTRSDGVTVPAVPSEILIISQTYVPDPAAVGQYMHDAAAELTRRGHRVLVYASERGYDDPGRRDPKRETRDGVRIRRLPLCSFGKGSIAIRLLGGFLFCMQVVLRGMWRRKVDRILVSTSPPMAPIAAIALKAIYRVTRFGRRTPMVFWAMDINPDQMIAMGKTHAGSWIARSFDLMIRVTLKRADAVVALDRYMGERLEGKVPLGDAGQGGKLVVLPPWPMEDHLAPVAHTENPFRAEHGWASPPPAKGPRQADPVVLMYSGNISDAHPVDTVIQAAARTGLPADGPLRVVFIGGEAGRAKVEAQAREAGAACIATLPFQPLDRIRFSLSAADVHLVTMGDAMVGIVHPCKVYGAMAVARPVLVVGPAESHAGRIVRDDGAGWQFEHGEVEALSAWMRRLADGDPELRAELATRGQAAHDTLRTRLSRDVLAGRFCDLFEGP